MLFYLFFILSLLPQDIPQDSIHYYSVLKKIPVITVSPFRGEPYILEVTQPFLYLDENFLSFIDISNKGSVPLPPYFQYYSLLNNIIFEEGNFIPPYLNQNLVLTFSPSHTYLQEPGSFPLYFFLKSFNQEVPFSQIRLFRDKKENEHMQFRFGRDITKYGRFNISADYTEETTETDRSIGLDTEMKLPLSTMAKFCFIDIKKDTSYLSFEDKFMFLSLTKKEGNIGIYKKEIEGEEQMGMLSDIHISLPLQGLTMGFNYPNFDSSYYRFLLVDRINPTPLLYIVPRFSCDVNRDYTASLGTGYHPLVNLFVYGNMFTDTSKTLSPSLGIRAKNDECYLEGFIYTRNKEPKENSGVVLFYSGLIFSDFHISTLMTTKFTGTSFLYLQPLYRKSFKNGKLKPCIFSTMIYDRNNEENEMILNAGLIIQIIDVSLFFVFNDVNSMEKRVYNFGVQWDFYN